VNWGEVEKIFKKKVKTNVCGKHCDLPITFFYPKFYSSSNIVQFFWLKVMEELFPFHFSRTEKRFFQTLIQCPNELPMEKVKDIYFDYFEMFKRRLEVYVELKERKKCVINSEQT